MATPSASALDSLASLMNGRLVRPGDASYDELRIVWNAMIDRRPAAIARPATVDDVVAVVNLARDNDLPLSVRGGGHSTAGYSTCDDGIVLDLRDLNAMHVDPDARRVSVGGGTLISQLDAATQEHGLAVPMGTVGHTGVGGLTLGGGLGRLTRMYGMSIDSLEAVEVVTAAGEVVTASEANDADLFWAMRGAGANFGVATRFDFRAYPIGTDLAAAMALVELDHARDTLLALAEYERSAPEHQVTVASLSTIPAAMPFPEAFHGRRMLFVGTNNFGAPERAEKEVGEVTALGPAAFSASLRLPYLAAQLSNDEKYAWGKRNYVKGGLVETLGDGAIDAALEAFARVPGDHSEIDFIMIGGASCRVDEHATAYSGRAARFFFGINAVWSDPAEDATHRDWARATLDAASPFLLGTNYINALEDQPDDVRTAYGPEKFDRLVGLKRRYDPGNLFRLNNNIKP